jgi:hypothetical protein
MLYKGKIQYLLPGVGWNGWALRDVEFGERKRAQESEESIACDPDTAPDVQLVQVSSQERQGYVRYSRAAKASIQMDKVVEVPQVVHGTITKRTTKRQG